VLKFENCRVALSKDKDPTHKTSNLSIEAEWRREDDLARDRQSAIKRIGNFPYRSRERGFKNRGGAGAFLESGKSRKKNKG